MAAKIRGYLWAMNYRGFDIYFKKNDVDAWQAVPSKNLINKDLATVEQIHHGESVADMMTTVDDHWEVLADMTEDGFTDHLL